MECTVQSYLDTRIRPYEAMVRVLPCKRNSLQKIQSLLDTDKVQQGQTKIHMNDIDKCLHILD